jgi:hypothetical protein
MKPRTASVKSADRVLDLLELLTRRGKGLSIRSFALRFDKAGGLG